MFYTLRKLIITSSAGVAISCALYLGMFLLERRAIFTPFVQWGGVVVRSEVHETTPVLTQLHGIVTRVESGTAFALRGPSATVYLLQLKGLETPNPLSKLDPEERRRGEMCRDFLKDLIANKSLRVDVTYLSPRQAGVGIAYLADTNLNVALVEAGMARVNPKFIRDMALTEQAALMTAQASAQTHKQGLWAE